MPPADLEQFLAAGPPPVFVGFGSRNPTDGARLTEIVAEARRQARVRMVVQAGWANLGAALQDDDDVLVIGEAPHFRARRRLSRRFTSGDATLDQAGHGPGLAI
jgi:sterol 3beta-glucosyltransferase